ncbi:MAG: cation:proton antiporter, partial [bacterium]|nr:cation:proton antiporter [bacterium]
PVALRREWKGATALGMVSFTAALGAEVLVIWLALGWSFQASLLAGIALAPTSIAIVYTVLIDSGTHQTPFGRKLLVTCFFSNLAAMLALGIAFARLSGWFAVYLTAIVIAVLGAPRATRSFFRSLNQHVSNPHGKYVLLLLLLLAGLAERADTQAILAAYLLGIALSSEISRYPAHIHQLRVMTFTLFTPFYFLKAGTYVLLPTLWANLLVVLVLLAVRVIAKVAACYPVCRLQGMSHRESAYTSLILSTGLTFDIIAAVFGLTHGYLNNLQYTILVGITIGSAVAPTVIAQTFFKPSAAGEKQKLHTLAQPQSGPAYEEG